MRKSLRAISLFELVLSIIILSIVLSFLLYKPKDTNLKDAVDRIKLYLNYTRYLSQIDNKYDIKDKEWEKKRWTLKFQECSNPSDGLYFVIYSDMSGGTSHFKKRESLKDPLTNKYLYSNYDCVASKDESKYVLLTKQYGISEVKISCNATSTIGQLSFAYNGEIYSKLGDNEKRIDKPCIIRFKDKKNNEEIITIMDKTGFIY